MDVEVNKDMEVMCDENDSQTHERELFAKVPTSPAVSASKKINTEFFYGQYETREMCRRYNKVAVRSLKGSSVVLKKQKKKQAKKPVKLTFPGIYKGLKSPKKIPNPLCAKSSKSESIPVVSTRNMTLKIQDRLTKPRISPEDRVQEHAHKLKVAANIIKENNKSKILSLKKNIPGIESVHPSQQKKEMKLKPVTRSMLRRDKVLKKDENVTSGLALENINNVPEITAENTVRNSVNHSTLYTSVTLGIRNNVSASSKIQKTPKSILKTSNRLHSNNKLCKKKVVFSDIIHIKKIETRAMHPTPNDRNNQLDYGQKDLGITACSTCSLLYDYAVDEDFLTHEKFHKRASILKHRGWKKEEIVKTYAKGQVIVISDDDPSAWKLKVNRSINFFQKELGCDPTIVGKHSKTYLFISQDMIIGYLVMEHLSMVYQNLSSGDLVPCSTEKFGVVCGVRQIWVAPGSRRKGFATKLLNSARRHFKEKGQLRKTDVLVWTPTEDGKEFFKFYMGTSSYMVYDLPFPS